MAELNPIKFKREDQVWIMRHSITGIPKVLGSFTKGGDDVIWTVHFMGDVMIADDEMEQIDAKRRELNSLTAGKEEQNG